MNKSILTKQVIIAPYNDNWPKMFAIEKAKILSVIGDKNAIVEHIGSTAIPN